MVIIIVNLILISLLNFFCYNYKDERSHLIWVPKNNWMNGRKFDILINKPPQPQAHKHFLYFKYSYCRQKAHDACMGPPFGLLFWK
jgi:hypothetical protein